MPYHRLKKKVKSIQISLSVVDKAGITLEDVTELLKSSLGRGYSLTLSVPADESIEPKITIERNKNDNRKNRSKSLRNEAAHLD